ncbi:MAG: alpha/beta hydrolase [Pseudobacteriovorax sp.]|nr:alpha/beta hydrolase [Pseudobacteriovorax sp.]
MNIQSEVIGNNTVSYLDFRPKCQSSKTLILCLHGFPDSPQSFESLATSFGKQGFRVICPYLKGYGPSAGHNDKDFYVDSVARDLKSLVTKLGFDRVILVGHDWGSAVVSAYSIQYAETVEKMILIGFPPFNSLIPSPIQFLKSWYFLFLSVPKLPVWSFGLKDGALFEIFLRLWSPKWDYQQVFTDTKAALKPVAARKAALSYYRNLFLIHKKRFHECYRLMRKPITVPTLAVAGGKDRAVDIGHFFRLKKGIKAPYSFEHFEDQGHFPHLEDPERFRRLAVEFVNWSH